MESVNMLGRLYELGEMLEKRGEKPRVRGVYVLTIDDNGEIMSIVDKRDFEVTIPFRKVNRTSNVAPNIIIDNPKYVFGCDKKGEKLKTEKDRKAYEKYKEVNREYIKEYVGRIEGAGAYYKFLDKEHDIKKHMAESGIKKLEGNIVFTVAGSSGYLHEDARYEKQTPKEEERDGVCSVTGIDGKVVDLVMNTIDRILVGRDKKDKNVLKYVTPEMLGGGKTTKISSSNSDMLNSYGWEKGYNASVSRDAAEKINLAMDYLIKVEGHCYIVDDMVIAVWKKHSEPHPEFHSIFGKGREQAEVMAKNSFAYKSIGKGYAVNTTEDNEEDFYIMGFSFLDAGFVNEFFYECRGKDNTKVMGNVRKHTERLKDAGVFVSLGGMLWASKEGNSTARKKAKRSTRSIKHLIESILWDKPLPMEYYIRYVSNLGKKLRGYNDVDNKIALTALVKVGTEQRMKEGENMKKTVAYQLGVMLAMGEKLQYSYIREKENRLVKRSLREDMYSFCESIPQKGMQRLDEKVRVYLKDFGGVWMASRYKEAVREIGELGGLPRKFTLEEKAAMMIGYYDADAERNPNKQGKKEKTKEGEVEI